VQLTRLQEVGENEGSLENWYVAAVVNAQTVDTVRVGITKFLKERQLIAEGDLLPLMESAQDSVGKRSRYKKAIERSSLRGIYGILLYMRKVLRLYEQGLLGQKDSIFSERSVRKVFRELWQVTLQVIDHLSGLAEAEKAKARRDCQRAIQLCDELDRVSGQRP
jgi:hypothetical protein